MTFNHAGLEAGPTHGAYPRREDGWVAALQHVLQLLTGGGPASCKQHTWVTCELLSWPQVQQPYHRAVLSLWHLLEAELSCSSSPMSSEACYKDAGSQHSGGMGEQQSKSKDGLQGYPNKLYPRTVKAHKDIQLSRAHCPDALRQLLRASLMPQGCFSPQGCLSFSPAAV